MRKGTFKRSVFIYVLGLVLAVSLAFFFVYVKEQRAVLENNLIQRGKILSEALAANLRLGLLTENQEFINEPVIGVLGIDDVLQVAVYRDNGSLISREGDSSIKELAKPSDMLMRITDGEALVILNSSDHTDFWAPVYYSPASASIENDFYPVPSGQKTLIGMMKLSLSRNAIRENIHAILLNTSVLVLLFILMASIISYYIATAVSMPLRSLVDNISEMGHTGIGKLPLYGDAEIAGLADAFNVMSDSLKNSDIERARALTALAESEEKFRTIFNSAGDGILIADIENQRFLTCNETMSRMLGYSIDEIGTMRIQDIHPAEQLPHVLEEFRKLSVGQIDTTRNIPVLRADGSVFFADITGTHIVLEGRQYVVGIFRDVTKSKQAEEELRNSREKLRHLSSYLQTVREHERTSIAREIHDDLGQNLTALKYDLAWIKNAIPGDSSSLNTKMDSTLKLVDSCIQDVKRISAELRPFILDDLGIVAAIEWQAKEFQMRTGIECDLSVGIDESLLDKDVSTVLFRIFQESITNIMRHAEATQVEINLNTTDDSVLLEIKDNGKGITDEEISDSKSIGLLGMKERVNSLGGTFSIHGIYGQGTSVVAKIPIKWER